MVSSPYQTKVLFGWLRVFAPIKGDPDQPMKFLSLVLACALATSSYAMERPGFHTKGSPTGKPTGPLKPGEYWWHPEIQRQGPLMILVSIPEQMMHVYRNGVLIGRSTISSGSKGHETPGGVFSILEKQQTYRSKKYDNAPMPNMQRLTWTGIAMHSGQLPGYAASHGCVRLPYDFSQLLFATTNSGGTVIIGDGKTPVPRLASNPGLMLAPADFSAGMLRNLGRDDYDWHPERSPEGPITIVISSADKAMYVYRNGDPIGRASVEIGRKGFMGGGDKLGDHVFTMLEGTTGRPSRFTPKHEEARWMRVTSAGRPVDPDSLASRLHFSPDFADKLANELKPGTTVIVTDYTVVRKPKTQSDVFALN
jgi:hypothetical protein